MATIPNKMRKDNPAYAYAVENGWDITLTGKNHIRFTKVVNGVLVTCGTSGTPSDKRAWLNALAELKRKDVQPVSATVAMPAPKDTLVPVFHGPTTPHVPIAINERKAALRTYSRSEVAAVLGVDPNAVSGMARKKGCFMQVTKRGGGKEAQYLADDVDSYAAQRRKKGVKAQLMADYNSRVEHSEDVVAALAPAIQDRSVALTHSWWKLEGMIEVLARDHPKVIAQMEDFSGQLVKEGLL